MEGGLGLKLAKEWNVACLLKNIWILITRAGSLWVAWLQKYVFKNHDFWTCPSSPSLSWPLSKLLKLRPLAQGVLSQCGAEFNLAQAWNCIRARSTKVNWHRMIWFNGNIPKHAIISWLAILGRLPTRDRLIRWGIKIADPSCLLCQHAQETANHLLFECPYSKELWLRIMNLCGFAQAPFTWNIVFPWCVTNFKGKSFISLICQLSFCACIYHIWKERNSRLHGEKANTVSLLLLKIARDIQNRTYSLSNISSDPVNQLLCQRWGISDKVFHT